MKTILFFLIFIVSTAYANISGQYDYSFWSNLSPESQCYKKIKITSTTQGNTRPFLEEVEWMEIIPTQNQWYMDKENNPLGILELAFYDKNLSKINSAVELMVTKPKDYSYFSIVSGDIFFKNRLDFPAANFTQIVEINWGNELHLMNSFKAYSERALVIENYSMSVVDRARCPKFSK